MLSKNTGKTGESLAASFLRLKGYKILDKNFRTRHGEIDLICQYQKEVIFVEVKTRTSHKFGYPEEYITETKIETIANVGQIYLAKKKVNPEWRIEAISILLNPGQKSFKIKHLTNISM